MWADRLRTALHRDDGFAMVTAIIVSSVLMMFTMGLMATGLHLTDATTRDRSWNIALQVAEAGVDFATYTLGIDDTYVGTGGSVIDVPGGQVEMLVDRPSDGAITIYSTGWVPTKTATNAVSRRIRADYAPEDVFSYALFSETGLYVKNNAVIEGDVFANEGVEVGENAIVKGSAISATEGVEIGNGAELQQVDGIGGSAYSGGPAGIYVNNTAKVYGDAYAEATSCAGSTPTDTYDVVVVGTGRVHGEALAWGPISGNVGSSVPFNCQLAQATKTLPEYNWDPSLYTGEQLYSTIGAFETYLAANEEFLTGVHRVWVDDCDADPGGAGTYIEMGGMNVSDDFVLVTNCRIDFSNDFTVSAGDDALIDIVVLNTSSDPPAVHIKNNLEIENDPAVLLYATGLITVKNNPNHNGAVYAGAISIKNNLDVTYDPRVERTLGFGDVKLDRSAWVECTVGTTGTDC